MAPIPVTERLLTPIRKKLDVNIQAHSSTLLDKVKTPLQERQEGSDEKALLPSYSIGSIKNGEIRYRPSEIEETLELLEIRSPKACLSPCQGYSPCHLLKRSNRIHLLERLSGAKILK